MNNTPEQEIIRLGTKFIEEELGEGQADIYVASDNRIYFCLREYSVSP